MKISGLDNCWHNNFKLGKCYEHPSGKQMFVCGAANTLAFGQTFIVERGSVNSEDSFTFGPIDLYDIDAYRENQWFEIPIDRFQLCNYQNSEKEITRLKNNIKIFDRKKKLMILKNKIR